MSATDPWDHLNVSAEEKARADRRHRADVTSYAALREHAQTDTCTCWRRDCDECGHRISDGKRPRSWS